MEGLIYLFDLVADVLMFFVLRRERQWDEEPERFKRLSEVRRQRIRERRQRWRKRRSDRSSA